MDNIRSTIDILFNQQEVGDILDSFFAPLVPSNRTMDKMVDKKWFCQSFQQNYKIYSFDQTEAIHKILCDKWMSPVEGCDLTGGKSIFNVLLHFTGSVLSDNGYEPICRYRELLRWHEMSKKVGQDIMTTAYFAAKDVRTGRKRHFFGWKPIIGHDNPSINHLQGKGIAELHFHLKGSSLNFEVNWLCLMNNIANRRAEFEIFDKSESRRIYLNCVKACAIRLYLMSVLYSREYLLKTEIYSSLFRAKENNELILYLRRLQHDINLFRDEYGHRYGKEVVDYAIPRTLTELYRIKEAYGINSFLAGERELLYRAFHEIFSDSEQGKRISTLYYAYLVAKEQVRHEFVQLDGIGFENFAEYESRKEHFISPGSIYEALIPHLAIRSTEANQNIQYIEARITPKNSNIELARAIRKNDGYINDPRFGNEALGFPLRTDPPLPEKVFYILHFIKEKEKVLKEEKKYLDAGRCRHSVLREKVKRQAFAIHNLMNSINSVQKRIVGIDAANTELGCRPEVFAQVFRFLRNHSYTSSYEYLSPLLKQPLGVTYHVGEDYMDLVDGLRALDEAILFLNLKENDRLGHALSLGQDALLYYTHKKKNVVISKLDFLDNVVWLSHKAEYFNVPIRASLKARLQSWYEELFREIYLLDSTTDIPSMYTYYLSWLLRGDSPESYEYDSEIKDSASTHWEQFALNKHSDEVKTARKNSKARNLYVRYHYDMNVKSIGRISDQFKIDDAYIECVSALQVAMRKDLVCRHIGIETNLSSNKVIGAFSHYKIHPITKFYNIGLEDRANENCPQISVSINTDDQGVFYTSIENEFALMALSLEKSLNSDQTLRFNPRSIYNWLNNVRELAFEQKFKKDFSMKY